ncbi:MAG: hypothetical protein KDD47_23335 [Acidobacteria bacterium]|nr:hypothetical protein [Acidobacteriota bacterium]
MTTRKVTLFTLSSLVLVAMMAPTSAAAADHFLGGGLESWRTADGLPSGGDFEDIKDEGSSWVLSYQYRPAGLFRFELDLEYFKDGFGGSTETAVAPQAFVLVGKGFYGGIGAGLTFSDGFVDGVSDPFYMGRLGFEFSLLGSLKLDLHATYRFDDWEGLEGIDVSTDTYTLGAAVRFKI